MPRNESGPQVAPKYTYTGTGSLDTSKLGRCKNCDKFNVPGATKCRHCGAQLS